MKSYKSLQEEIHTAINEANDVPVAGAKRAFYSVEGRSTSTSGLEISNVIKPLPEVVGWFSNSRNPAGWALFKLDNYDVSWLKKELPNLDNVFRSSTDKSTSIIKINAKTGTYGFVDNRHYQDTDEFKFEKASPYQRLIIDDQKYLKLFM